MADDPFSSVVASASQALGLPPPGTKRETLLATRFQQATFKGVPFFIEQVESDFGRRTVDREYPKRDDPYSEDLGRKAREFTFEAFVLGADYETQRDALITACESPYSGPLMHPYLGRMDVVCKGLKVRERKDHLGMAVLSLTFKEAGKLIYPAATGDDTYAIVAAANGLSNASASNFTSTFGKILSAPSYVLSAAQTRIGQVSDLVNGTANLIKKKLVAIDSFVYSVKNLKAQVAQIINTPALLAAQMHDTINLISSIIPGNDRTAALVAYQALYTATPLTFQNLDKKAGKPPITVLPAPTAANAVILTNMEQAVANHVARVAIAAACTEAVANPWASLNDALAAQAALVSQLDTMAGATSGASDTDDQVYAALIALRAQVFKSVPPANQSPPQLATYTPPGMLPSLVIAYDLYGASKFNDDLVNRNKIRHPLFVPAGKPISILRGVA